MGCRTLGGARSPIDPEDEDIERPLEGITGRPRLPRFNRGMIRFGAANFPDDAGNRPGGKKEPDQERNDHASPAEAPPSVAPCASL